jgi:hypothetical protein
MNPDKNTPKTLEDTIDQLITQYKVRKKILTTKIVLAPVLFWLRRDLQLGKKEAYTHMINDLMVLKTKSKIIEKPDFRYDTLQNQEITQKTKPLTLDEVKNQYAKRQGYEDWKMYYLSIKLTDNTFPKFDTAISIIAELYAQSQQMESTHSTKQEQA